ncbi:myristylated membrane protein [carnivorous sponge associated iridovirus]|nr:myristylated membrane protein [carnivorous sponge associated iridovirus]
MGASVSKNVSNAVTKAVAKVSSNIIQNTQLSQDMAQVVSVRDVHGDVHISGNTFTQHATVNMHTLLDALSTEEAQQSIMQELAQEAKSVTSDLNIGQFSDAQNTMNLLMQATINLLTSIGQTCKAFNRQHQAIVVKRVSGNVYIQDNVFQQMYNILQNCTEKAASNNRLLQDLSSKMSQTASAKSEGISDWVLVALLAVFIGIPVIGGVVAGQAILKFIFPIILVAGIVLLVLYYVRGKQVMKEVGFSTFIENTPLCMPSRAEITPSIYANTVEASNACKANATCKAFDWKGIDVAQNGTYTVLDDPVTKFYSGVSDKCSTAIKPDNVKLLRYPVFFQGDLDPNDPLAITGTVNKGDVYLNTTNGVWSQKVIQWQPRGTVTTNSYNRIAWGYINPTTPRTGNTPYDVPILDSPMDDDVYVYANQHNPAYLYLFRYDTSNGWVQEQKIKGPGLVPDTPAIINSSGIKEIEKTAWMLYAGIAGIVIGAIGSVITLYTKKEKYANYTDFEW